FFFSSRRRHTRSKRDWSSDVCSSDLLGRFNDTNPHEAHIEFAGRNIRHWPINYVRRRMVISEAMPHLFSGPILEALDPFYARSPQPDNGDQESHEDRMSRVTMALWNADGTEIVE